MKSIAINKHPPQQKTTVRNGLRTYIRYYGLILDRFKWAAEDEKPTLQYDDIQRYIAQLLDPLAFQGGETELVQNIQSEFKQIKNSNWAGQKFSVKTIVETTGSSGGLLTPSKKATVKTLAGTGRNTNKFNSNYIIFPPLEQNWVKARIQIENWKNEFNKYYCKPQENTVLEIGFKPTDKTDRFKFYFKIGNAT